MTHFTAHIILGFSFVFTLCVNVDVDAFFIVLILLFRRIPEIQSRQFHLLLPYLSMTAAALCSIFIQYTIVIC